MGWPLDAKRSLLRVCGFNPTEALSGWKLTGNSSVGHGVSFESTWAFMAVPKPKPMLTKFGIRHRWESCV